MSPDEVQAELESARAEIAHLKLALQGTQRWVDRLLEHCKKHGLAVTHRDVLGDEGWIDQGKIKT